MWRSFGVGMERSGMTYPHIARKQVRSELPNRLLAAKRKQTCYATLGLLNYFSFLLNIQK
jgi:hypothetical protein